MNNSYVQLIGRLGAAPQVGRTESGIAYARISVGCSDGHFDKDKQEWVDKISWIPVTLWRSDAEKAEKGWTKGSLVRIEAKLTYGKNKGKNGEEIYSFGLVPLGAQLLYKKADGPKNESAPTPPVSPNEEWPTIEAATPLEFADDLPF